MLETSPQSSRLARLRMISNFSITRMRLITRLQQDTLLARLRTWMLYQWGFLRATAEMLILLCLQPMEMLLSRQ